MLTVQLFAGFTLLLGPATGKACHGSHCPVPGPGEVDSAIDHLHMHYNDRLCLEILLLDCTKHTVVGDERVCGNDGNEYADHCYFAHARCEFLHSGHVLNVAHVGPCHELTTTTSTMTTTVGSSLPPVTDDHTLVSVGTAMPVTTTKDPIYGIIQNVFCQNTDGFVCNQELDAKCGSDGYWYRNSCEFSKEKCTTTDLVMMDESFCNDRPTQ